MWALHFVHVVHHLSSGAATVMTTVVPEVGDTGVVDLHMATEAAEADRAGIHVEITVIWAAEGVGSVHAVRRGQEVGLQEVGRAVTLAARREMTETVGAEVPNHVKWLERDR